MMMQLYALDRKSDKCLEIFNRMYDNGHKIKESSYGHVLDCCINNQNLEQAFKLYEKLGDHFFNQNSIVYTTLIKGSIKLG